MVAAGLVSVAGAWFVTVIGSLFVSTYMKKYTRELKVANQDKLDEEKRGFADGGKQIGHLERFLIYLFVLAGQLEGVGFLVAAKSVFRFGELTNEKNRLEAEYITIGTLLSFSFGLAVSLVIRLIITAISSPSPSV
jgi:hypothetical protein